MAIQPKPVVSVVIPAHNAEPFIAEAVNSVLCQSCPDLEVIVVDDGSSDGTAAVVTRMDDPRIRLHRQHRQGQSTAINTGVEQAQGAYIKLLDADDWLNPKHLESQLAVLDGQDNSVASCRWGYFVNDVQSTIVFQEHTHRDYGDAFDWLIDSLTKDEGMMGGWLWLIPRRVWDIAGGYDPRLSLNNDFHFSIRLLLASNGVRYARDAIYGHRKPFAQSLSASGGREAMESAFLTTDLGTALLIERENSPRVRKICADRFQHWIHRFHPEFPDLVARAERCVAELGGSDLKMEGGFLFRALEPVLGWKRTREMQCLAARFGWGRVQQYKARRRLAKFQ